MMKNNKAFANLAIKLISGRLPKNDNEIVIPSHLKTNGRVNYKVGDTIHKGDTLSKSTAYDDFENYGFGRNIKSMYLVDLDTLEDAIVVSEIGPRLSPNAAPDTIAPIIYSGLTPAITPTGKSIGITTKYVPTDVPVAKARRHVIKNDAAAKSLPVKPKLTTYEAIV